MKKITLLLVFLVMLTALVSAESRPDNVFVHLKTGLKKDDAQICVAYNVVWTALHEGKNVNALIDADAVNTFRIGWRGKDSIEKYAFKCHLNMTQASLEPKSEPCSREA